MRLRWSNRFCTAARSIPASAATVRKAEPIRWRMLPPGPTTFARCVRKPRREIAEFCPLPESCVTQAITDEVAILRSPGIDPQKKADALRFLIHFVGDLHQPLHATSNNDQGGNCVPVAFFDALPQLRNPDTESYAPNLHGVWDTNILERMTTGKTSEQVASELEESFRSQITRWKKASADVNGWAWESYRLAQKAYGKLPSPKIGRA